ncbi:NUDIX domain-containing protein [Rickettsiales endosymbiont of Peranema trichophorum]|uniref:NUDIX domain-containing protein n=1 Tax=Rickettsiales endosymbiont of Peranema trichophorum TaxID=2486577 RepID=UPI0010237B55|nr:NUDIX domain-containing protein [Rickettsiales endosymbiont of Peranema trichophorum]RZI45419.1 NUDIX domain-containing protein [Rickettsiales endosymbiont of Peranema trichophorum]
MPIHVVPHLILMHGDNIFLSRRAATQKFSPGYWHCVSGTIEDGETPREAITRETKEEIGITLSNPPKLVVTVSVREQDFVNEAQVFDGLSLFFLGTLEEGQIPFNNEPTKQDLIGWFFIRNLPSPIVPSVKFGVTCFVQGQNYGEFQNLR